MLNRSFIFAPGMTEDLERALWGRGVLTWEVLRRHPGEVAAAIGEQRAKKLQGAVGELTDLIQRRDLAAFNRIWPEKESWRLWEGWCASDEVALVDIETTGLTPGFDQITLIGLSRGGHEQVFVADRALGEDKPLDTFPDAMKGVRLLVTFNGVGFDAPFIERHFRARGFTFEMPHLDLMFPARAAGLTGGLKDMEKQVGIVRADDIKEVRGSQAIALWGAWKQGDRASYDKLTAYCKADCRNLAAFAAEVYRRRKAQVHDPYAKAIDLDAAMGQQLSLF